MTEPEPIEAQPIEAQLIDSAIHEVATPEDSDIHGVPYTYGNRRARRAALKRGNGKKQMHLDKRQVAMLLLTPR